MSDQMLLTILSLFGKKKSASIKSHPIRGEMVCLTGSLFIAGNINESHLLSIVIAAHSDSPAALSIHVNIYQQTH